MMRSLFSAVSGLRTHQTRMDVIGNNVANVNTPGFKSSRVTFQEVFSQTLRGASSPSDMDKTSGGGTNPMQVGLGVATASIDMNHTSGNLQPTSKMTDVAIEGQGFFVVSSGSSSAYTRVGAFDTDGDGILVDTEGRKVLGWVADTSGSLPTDKSPDQMSPIRIAIGSNMPASATDVIKWGKNLDSGAPEGTVRTIPVTVFDSQGRTHAVTITFTKSDSVNSWAWAASGPSALGITGAGTLTFGPGGNLVGSTGNAIGLTPDGVFPLDIALDFSQTTQVSGPSTIGVSVVNGCPTGALESFSFDSRGTISGFYSNGETQILGQLAIANFANPGGLLRQGKNIFIQSNNSGAASIGEAGTSGRGTIAPSALEMSNVDLAEEFTQMIITQRGFQANSRVITVADELLQELVSLKR